MFHFLFPFTKYLYFIFCMIFTSRAVLIKLQQGKTFSVYSTMNHARRKNTEVSLLFPLKHLIRIAKARSRKAYSFVPNALRFGGFAMIV